MTSHPLVAGSGAVPSRWDMVVESLRRRYPVSLPMVVFLLLVPCYFVIGDMTHGRAVHVPALALDRALHVQPAWALVYGSLYLFLIVLPVFVVRQEDLLRRTVLAYLAVWVTAYVCFLLYPTIAPRPAAVVGGGFLDWGLRFLYWADTPYNCFPSIHVAHSFVSALACYRVHRRVGIGATCCAAIVAVSTLYIRQHYVVDVIAGFVLACVAYAVFLHGAPRKGVPESDRRLAPVFVVGVGGLVAIVIAGFWVAYRLSGGA